MKAIALFFTPLFLAAVPPTAALAKHTEHHVGDSMSQDALAQGEVRKVDKEAGKMTIKHGPLANLDMPPMTMVFRVKDPALLEKVKEGDAIRFKAERIEGKLTVTEVEPAR
jgi:Cu(I)/Ag(I) efflux system protein CusF